MIKPLARHVGRKVASMKSKVSVAVVAVLVIVCIRGHATDIVGPPIDVWSDAGDNFVRDVVYNPENDEYLVLIENNWGGSEDIYGQRVDADGTLLSWFAVVAFAGERHIEPSAVYSPPRDEYLVVWCRQGGTGADDDILARTVAWNGASMGPLIEIDVAPGYQQDPDVEYNSVDDEYLVVYDTFWMSGVEEVNAVRVRASDGSLAGAAIVAGGATDTHQYAHVSYNESENNYLIAYTVNDASVAAKLAPADLVDVGSVSETEIRSYAYRVSSDLGISYSNGEFLVAWNEYGTAGKPGTIRGRRVGEDGVALGPADGFVIQDGATSWSWRDAVGVSSDGYGSFIMAWDAHDLAGLGDIWGGVLRPGSDATVGQPVPVSDSIPEQYDSAIDCALSGACLIASLMNLRPLISHCRQ